MFHVEQFLGGEKLGTPNKMKVDCAKKKYKKIVDKTAEIVLRGCDCFFLGEQKS